MTKKPRSTLKCFRGQRSRGCRVYYLLATVRGARFLQFKLRTHLLDLRGLLFELGCESLYLFLLQRDSCLQLLNFVIEHGLVLGLGAGAREVARCATRHRCAKGTLVAVGTPTEPSQACRS